MKNILVFRSNLLAAAAGALLAVSTASAQTGPRLIQNIDHVPGLDAQDGVSIAINPGLSRIYLGSDFEGGSTGLKLIDTATNLALSDPVADVSRFSSQSRPVVVADPAGGRYYQLDRSSQRIGVCDAATDTLLSTINLGAMGATLTGSLAINTVTKTLYVASGYGYDAAGQTGRVYVINLATGTLAATVAVNSYALALAVDETLNRVFVLTKTPGSTSADSSVVNVIDGATLAVSAIGVPGLVDNTLIGINPVTHRVYASVSRKLDDSTTVTEAAVIDGSGGTVAAQVPFGPPINHISSFAADPATNRVFVGGTFYDNGRAGVRVLDGGSNALIATIAVTLDATLAYGDPGVGPIVDDPTTSRLYVIVNAQKFSVIDARTLTRLPDAVIPFEDLNYTGQTGKSQQKSAVDPGLNRLFTFNEASDSVTVIDLAAGRTIKNIPFNPGGSSNGTGCIAVNPATHTVYVSSIYPNQVNVIDGASMTLTATLSVNDGPRELAVDGTRNLVYVSTEAGLVVLDGASNTQVGSVVTAPRNLNSTSYRDHTALAVNETTNRVYVTGYSQDPTNSYLHNLEVDVIDGASRTVIDRLQPAAREVATSTGTLAVNPVTNKIYFVCGVSLGQGTYTGLYEIDGATDAVTAINPPPGGNDYADLHDAALAVDARRNRVYIAAGEGNFYTLIYFDAGARTFKTFGSPGNGVNILAFDATRGLLYHTVFTKPLGNQTRVYASDAAFFAGEAALSNGVYYLQFAATGNPFGYYSYLTDPRYIYHFDLGYEYVFDAADGHSGVYLYDFESNGFFYTSPVFPFPYLYDFTLNTVLYYFPDPNNAGHYNTDGVRYFVRLDNGQIFSK